MKDIYIPNLFSSQEIRFFCQIFFAPGYFGSSPSSKCTSEQGGLPFSSSSNPSRRVERRRILLVVRDLTNVSNVLFKIASSAHGMRTARKDDYTSPHGARVSAARLPFQPQYAALRGPCGRGRLRRKNASRFCAHAGLHEARQTRFARHALSLRVALRGVAASTVLACSPTETHPTSRHGRWR